EKEKALAPDEPPAPEEKALAPDEPPAPEEKARLSPRKKALLIMIAILGAALLTGGAALYNSESFHGLFFHDHIQIRPNDTETSPETIEVEYYLPEIPAGFRLAEKDATDVDVYYRYEDGSGKYIIFTQDVKDGYISNPDNEHSDLTKIHINGLVGYYLDSSDENSFYFEIFWDNGDYILNVSTNLTKEETLNLAKSAKILEK
ncbi:MAG: DUF4367 domain-containing protein, partial [Eubacterium sp.]|nr:DUF4367 domain-containing protein [Eubacterium sp.]